MISFTSLLAGFQTCYCSLWFMIKTTNFKIKFNLFQTKQSNIPKKKQYTEILSLLHQQYIRMSHIVYTHRIQTSLCHICPDIAQWLERLTGYQKVLDSRFLSGARKHFSEFANACVANNLPLNYPVKLQVISYISRRDSKQLFLVKCNAEV